jgi:hypothetical protein
MKVARVIAAHIVSPLAGAIYWVVLNWLLNRRDPELLRDPLAIVGILLLFATIGYVAEGLLGTPLLCWFRRRGYSRCLRSCGVVSRSALSFGFTHCSSFFLFSASGRFFTT